VQKQSTSCDQQTLPPFHLSPGYSSRSRALSALIV